MAGVDSSLKVDKRSSTIKQAYDFHFGSGENELAISLRVTSCIDSLFHAFLRFVNNQRGNVKNRKKIKVKIRKKKG